MRINRKLPSGYDGCHTAHKTSPGNISATPQNANDAAHPLTSERRTGRAAITSGN
jgi:hypothetical protein